MSRFKNIDINDYDKSKLVNLEDIKINTDLSIENRKEQFIEQAGNPYAFKCNGIVVKNTYSNNGKTLDQLLEKLIVSS